MDNLFTRDDIDLAIAGCHTFLNSGLLEQPEIIRGYRESVDLTGETKKTLNLLENVLHWMKKAEAAPQAQEEPSGAPAPVSRWSKDNPCPWCKSCGIPAEHHKEGWYVTGSDGKPCTEFVPWEYPEPQPPAPASPGGLVCRTCNVQVGSLMEFTAAGVHAGHDIGAPAAPEAGAPGTQGACLWTEVADGDGYFESSCGVSMAFQEGGGPKDDADYIHCQKCGKKIELDEPPTQTQEGGSHG